MLFENISEKNKGKILKLLEVDYLTLPKGINFFSMINEKNFIGFIEYGAVQIIRNDYNGNKIIVEDDYSGDLFGTAISIVPSDEFLFMTKEETKIIVIDYDRIFNINDSKYDYYNQFVRNLLRISIDKTRERNERIEILSKKSIRNRILEYFRIVSGKSMSKTVYLPFSYTELADFLAVDRCAMTRELKNLKEEGFIKTAGRKITMLY